MKTIVILTQNNSSYSDKKEFDGKSAEDLVKEWALKVSDKYVYVQKGNCVRELLCNINEACKKENADTVIFSFDDLPFLDEKLTKSLLDSHFDFKSEYTYADGYPYGFAPEVIDSGAINILYELSKTTKEKEGNAPVNKDCIFNFLKSDINSFEVESVIAEEDYRLYRFNFCCDKKENFIACKKLFELTKNKNLSVNEKCLEAVKSADILQTVPGFYNFQIASKCSGGCSFCPYPSCYKNKFNKEVQNSSDLMKFEDFSKAIDEIYDLSESAVISLSLWGECFNHPDLVKFVEKVLSYKSLSVFIETDGLLVDENICNSLKTVVDKAEARTNGFEKIYFAVSMDAFTAKTYSKLHNCSEQLFEKCVNSISLLKNVTDEVYPQFVRMNDNEEELENFYRYWNEQTNASGGKLIIQKYDSFSGLLPDYKPADLSPIERNVCWHLRRDLCILNNGDSPLCKEFIFNNITGNVFKEGIESVWLKTKEIVKQHLENNYCKECKVCDEYYTYNF